MILQALYQYYQRKAADPDSTIAPIGFTRKEIAFIIVIDRDGNLVDLQDTRIKYRKKLIGKQFLLPQAVGRSGKNAWKTAFLLWDHYGYVLGQSKTDDAEAVVMAGKQLNSFQEKLRNLPAEIKADDGIQAVIAFYQTGNYKKVETLPTWADCKAINGCNLTFRLDGDGQAIAERKAIVNYQKSIALQAEEGEVYQACCLITGEKQVIQRLHGPTAILGGQSTGKLFGFQKNSGYDSYGKEQGFNAPVGKYGHAAYITALSTLLTSDNSMRLADATVVFWSDKPSQLEQDFNLFFCEPTKEDNPDRGIKAVRALYQSVQIGTLEAENNNSFYVLGLAPNVARISVRFWSTGNVLQYANKIKTHFDDLEIVKSDRDQEFFSLHKLLSHTALEYKISNVPQSLAGAVVHAVLAGTPYPATLLQQCMRRIRAERKVNRIRAAILKAFINRKHRQSHKSTQEEISVSLDKNNMNPAYRLGRLFAVLENIQERAQGKGTIRERFYGAASCAPVTVFPLLLKLKNHHLAKLAGGSVVYYENILADIFAGIANIPSHLPLEAQARFAVGYYHQRQDLFTKKEKV